MFQKILTIAHLNAKPNVGRENNTRWFNSTYVTKDTLYSPIYTHTTATFLNLQGYTNSR